MTEDLKALQATSDVLDIVKWMSQRILEGESKGQDVKMHKHIRNKVTDLYLHANDIGRQNELLKRQIHRLYEDINKLELTNKDLIAQRDALQSITDTF